MPKIVWWYDNANDENHLTRGEDLPNLHYDSFVELVIEYDEGEQPTFYNNLGKEIGVENSFPAEPEGLDETDTDLNEVGD